MLLTSMKNLLLALLSLLVLGGCTKEEAPKITIDLDEACSDLNSERCEDALDLVYGKETRKEVEQSLPKTETYSSDLFSSNLGVDKEEEIEQVATSSYLNECLMEMEKARNQVERTCGFSYKTKEGGLGGYIGQATFCKNRANQQYPDAICYGAKVPELLPPINSSKVCNFKDSMTGIVIQGDCDESSIWIGNSAYRKF